MSIKRKYGLNPISEGLHNNTLFEPQRSNHFEVYLYLPVALAGGDRAKIEDFRKYITLATTDFSLPTISTSPIELPHGNSMVKVAGGVEYSSADSLECIDYIGADVQKILYDWQMLVFNPETGQVGWARNYKTDGVITEYSPDGEALSTWIIKGVWPSSISYGDGLSKADGNEKKINVTLEYDVAYRKYDSSTRHNHDEYADNARANMTWKDTDGYKETNEGGPIAPFEDQF